MKNPHPESKWTHPICPLDYSVMEPGRTPARVLDGDNEVCCWCGDITSLGIFYRADPEVVHATR